MGPGECKPTQHRLIAMSIVVWHSKCSYCYCCTQASGKENKCTYTTNVKLSQTISALVSFWSKLKECVESKVL